MALREWLHELLEQLVWMERMVTRQLALTVQSEPMARKKSMVIQSLAPAVQQAEQPEPLVLNEPMVIQVLVNLTEPLERKDRAVIQPLALTVQSDHLQWRLVQKEPLAIRSVESLVQWAQLQRLLEPLARNFPMVIQPLDLMVPFAKLGQPLGPTDPTVIQVLEEMGPL
jgi:hypothetical protein